MDLQYIGHHRAVPPTYDRLQPSHRMHIRAGGVAFKQPAILESRAAAIKGELLCRPLFRFGAEQVRALRVRPYNEHGVSRHTEDGIERVVREITEMNLGVSCHSVSDTRAP